MPKFEDRFVHFTWDESLKGKLCFVADNIPELKSSFEDDNRKTVTDYSNKCYPFSTETGYYRFAYYDKNYDVKKAYEQGKQIQYKAKDTGRWCDWDDSLSKCTFVDGVEYRIKSKPERNAYVILNQTVGEPTLLWNFDKEIEKETRHVYFRGTPNECLDYIESHNKFVSIMKAWENGEQIEFKSVFGTWLCANFPDWNKDLQYRIKPEGDDDRKVLKWTDLNIGDIIELCSEGHRKAMVIEIDFTDDWERHIYAGCHWITDEELENWRKVKAV